MRLEAPGTITHLGWIKSPRHHYSLRSYQVRWNYTCPHGLQYALGAACVEEEFEIIGADGVEQNCIGLVNSEYLSGHMMRECGCNPHPLDYYYENPRTGKLEHLEAPPLSDSTKPLGG